MKRAACALAVLAMLLAGPGCLWRRARTNVADLPQRMEGVVEGQTTVSQLEEIMGSPPNNVIQLSGGGAILLYAFGDSKTNGMNLILLEITKTNVGVDSAIFIVDANNVIQEMTVSNNSQDLEWEFWAFGD